MSKRSLTGSFGRLALDDFPGLYAAGADAHSGGIRVARDLCFYGAQIDAPAATGFIVGVRDIVTGLRTFAAEFTFGCHCFGAPDLFHRIFSPALFQRRNP